jgi:hypothetical protein
MFQLLIQLHPPVVEVEVVVQILVRLRVLVRLVVQVVELDGRLLLEEPLEQEIHLQQLPLKVNQVEIIQAVEVVAAAVEPVLLDLLLLELPLLTVDQVVMEFQLK